MKSKLSALVVLMLGLSLGNCDLLGVSLIDKSDFNIKDFKPSPSATFIKGLKFSQEDVANELLGTGEDADLEIPLLGDALKAAGAPGGLIVLAKEVEYKGDYKWQLAALIKIDGDKLQYKNQKFPAASGKGNYGMFVAATTYAFVTGKAVDCDGKAKAGIWAISGDEHNYLTQTDSKGKYGLPFEVGKESGKSISLSIADEDCGGGAAVSVPMKPEGETDLTPEEQKVDDEGNAVEPNAELSQCNGGEETMTEAPDAPPLRAVEEGETGRELTTDINVCTDLKVVILKSSGATTENLGDTTTTSVCNDNKAVISTGGSGVAGTAAALDFQPSGKTTVTVLYSIASQEYPQYALGAFNDAIGIGFVGASQPGAVDSVGVRQTSGDMRWAFNATTAQHNQWDTKLNEDDENTFNWANFGLDLTSAANTDSTKNNPQHKGEGESGTWTRFGGVTAANGTAATYTELEAKIEIPREISSQDVATLLIAVGDVGDQLFDTAVIIHSISFE